ncbi:hypothetical protein [uncultured Rhodoblastus sp.]|uniref:PGN_0703 family putative restriction endonuclease n=1 Tax=uncultured Rhodoblastus sp. TaxID=543037 RepID=UPI0025F098F4|nr:hypothetical protein [uncultured Rhodoblastus sp.]
MVYYERERNRMISARDRIFKDPGLGVFSGKQREFVLSDPAGNLWPGIHDDAIDYFSRNQISWWRGEANEPTAHMLSSQVACVNHLYAIRQRQDLATAILQAVDPEIVEAEIVDDGYVEFEFIGKNSYLHESPFSRGKYCTSIDAFMIGRTKDGERRAFLIEWKYTESYQREDKYIPVRAERYDHLIKKEGSPFVEIDTKVLYYEPFYQLMRQTLLGWQLAVNHDYGCSSYRHVHVVPEENVEFHRNVTSPDLKLKGATVSEAWTAVLKQPNLYISTTPTKFLQPVVNLPDTKSLTGYLQSRYWPCG